MFKSVFECGETGVIVEPRFRHNGKTEFQFIEVFGEGCGFVPQRARIGEGKIKWTAVFIYKSIIIIIVRYFSI